MLFDPSDTDVISAAINDETRKGGGSALRSTLAAVSTTDPAAEAARQKLSRRYGVQIVDTKSAGEAAEVDDIGNAIKAESATGRWLSNPENAAVARKDYTKLQALEEAARRTRYIQDPSEREARRVGIVNELMGQTGFGPIMASQGRSFLSGGTGLAALPYDTVDVVAGAMGAGKPDPMMAGDPRAVAAMAASKYASDKSKALRERMRATPDVLVKNEDGTETINWSAMSPTNAGGWENIVNAVTQEAIPTAAQWLLGAATAPATGGASLAPAVASTGRILNKVSRIAKAAWRYARSPVSAVNAARVIQGQYQQGVQELMADGMSESEARTKAAPGAMLAGVLSPMFGGWAEAKIMEDLATRVAKTSEGYRLGARVLAYVKGVAVTGLKEGAQELSEGIGEDLSSLLTYKPDMGWKDFVADGLQNFVGGMAVGGPMGGVGHSMASIRSAQMAQFVEALGDVSKSAEFAKIAPEKMGDFVAHLTKGGPLENLFMDGQSWERFWQGKGIDPQQKAVELGVRPEDYAAALASNSDLILSTPAVAQHLAPTEFFGEILSDLKTRMNGPTIAEEQNLHAAAVGVQQQIAELEKSYQEHPELVEETNQVADLMEKELTAANKLFDAGARRDIAEAHARVIGALAARTGGKLSPMQVYERERLNIKRDVYDPLSAMGVGPRRISPLAASAMSLLRRAKPDARVAQDIATPAVGNGPAKAGSPASANADLKSGTPAVENGTVKVVENPSAPEAGQAHVARAGEARPTTAPGPSKAPGPNKEAPVEGSVEPVSEPVDNEAARGLSERLADAFREAGVDINGLTDEEALDELQRWLTHDRLLQPMSTRVPSTKATAGSHLEQMLYSNYAAMRESPNHMQSAVNAIAKYPGVKVDTTDPEKAAEKFISHATANLLALFDAVPKAIRDEAKLWYEGANKIAKQWAKEHSLELSQVAAAIAALSPSAEWFNNLEQARMMLQVLRDQQRTVWSPEMDAHAKATPTIAKEKELANVRGKKLGELTNNLQRAIWIRTFNETHTDRSVPIATPSGKFTGEVAHNQNGSITKLNAQTFSAMTKALDALGSADKAVLDRAIGTAHKVRNFYNNIFDPSSPYYVTIDTHAVGAGLLLPRGQDASEVAHVFGGNAPGVKGAGSSGDTGMGGTYGLYQEAYTRAAEARGVLPREMQSITWEAVRSLFSPDQRRSAKFTGEVEALWGRFTEGKASREKTIKDIFKLAGGISTPAWHREEVSGPQLMSELDAQAATPHINVEAQPGEGFTPEVVAALTAVSSEEVYNYHVAKMAIVEDVLGGSLNGVTRSDGVGYWEGQTNHSTSFTLKPESDTDLDEAAAAAAALAWSAVRDQDAVGWNTVHVAENVDEANGMLWELPRPLDKEEAVTILKAFDVEGLSDIGFVDSTDLTTLRVIIFDFDPAKASEIHERIVGVFNRSLPTGMSGHRALLYKAGSGLAGKDNYREHLNSPAGTALLGAPAGVKRVGDNANRRVQRLNRKLIDSAGARRLYQGAPRFRARSGGENAIEVHGAHYSPQEGLTALEPSSYGSGSPGAEGMRLAKLDKNDPLRQRSYFYASKNGVLPQREVEVRGLNAYDTKLDNIYDAQADPEGLRAAAEGDPNAFERAVIAANYDGYWSPRPGMEGSVVMLGTPKVPVRSLGRVSLEQARGKAPITLEELHELRGTDGGVEMRYHQAATFHPVSPTSPAFRAWFGGPAESDLVNDDGSAMRLFHGTDHNFTKFKESSTGAMGRGVYLGQVPEASEGYGDRLMPVYARGRYLSNAEWSDYVGKFGWDKARAAAEKDGWAGVRDDKFESAVCVWDPKNIKSAMANTGKFSGQNSSILYQSAYHGSPFSFDRFSLEHLGKGEGAQAFGWGLYFASKRDVADFYRTSLSGGVILNAGKPLVEGSPEYVAAAILLAQQGNLEEALEDARYYPAEDPKELRAVRSALRKLNYEDLQPSKGQLYHVDIPDAGYLQWDEPATGHALEAVRKAFTDAGGDVPQTNLTGRAIYNRLTDLLRSKGEYDAPKAASLALHAAGLAGIRYLDGVSRVGGEEQGYNYVVFDERSVKVLETYYQEGGAQAQGVDYPRGYLEPGPRGSSRKFDIGLLENENKSTVFHELGHYYLEVMGDLVESGDADPSLQADYNTILQWFGVSSRNEITPEMHEQFADGHLIYLRDGKAPLPELRQAFRRFSRWLKKIGETLLGVDVKLTPEVRDVFDRLYAAEEAIDIAKQSASAGRFTTAEEAGMTAAQFELYRKKLDNLALDAHDKVVNRVMRAAQEKLEADWKAEFEERKAAAMEELQKEPGRVAAEAMRAGSLDGETEADLKLNYMQTLDALGYEVTGSLPGDLIVDDGGLDPDSAAALFGFNTADDLAQALIGMKPLEQAAEERATEAMRAEHGDLTIDRDELHAVAMAEANSDAMTDIIASELKSMLAKSKSTVDNRTYHEMVAAMKVFAERHIADMAQFKVRPNDFLQAAKKAGNEAYRAAKSGKAVEAAEFKKKELLNQHLYRAAVEAKELGERFRTFVKRSDKPAVRKKMGRAGKGYLAAFDKVRDMFTIERVPNKVLGADKNVMEWAKEREAEECDVILDPELFDGTVRNYRSLTTAQLSSLYDTLRNIKHLAYNELEEVIDGQRVEREQMVNELVASIRAAGPSKRLQLSGSAVRDTAKFKAAAALTGIDATLMKIEQLVNWIDDDDVKGAAHKYIWNRIAAAQTAEYDYHTKITKVMGDVLKRMPKEMRTSLSATVTVDGFFEPLSRKQIMTMLFYMGQAERRDKLMGGFAKLGIGEDAVLRAVGMLKPEEAHFVNDVWAELDTMWGDIASMEERLSGVAPKKQDNVPFTLRDAGGNLIAHMTGGYFPLVADPEHTGELAKKQEGGTVQQVLSGNGYARAATSTGHVKELTGKVYPLLLDFEHTLTAHMTNVIKDLTHREVVLSVNRILQNEEFSQAVKEVFGTAYEAQLMPWLVNIVKDHNVGSALGLSAWHKAMAITRGNTVAAMLAFKFSTVIVQVTDFARLFSPGEYRVKPVRFASAMLQCMAHPVQMANMVYELSGEMRHRAENLDRDLRAAYEELQGNTSLKAKWNRWGFKSLGVMDKMTSLPAWVAAYHGAMKDHGDSDRAVLEADRTVRMRLMTGNPKDMIAAQRNDGLMRMLTMFMGDATANYNMLRNAGHNIKGLKGIGSFTMTSAIVALSSVMGDIIKGQLPDDDDDLAEWLAVKSLLSPLSTIPVVRDGANVVEGQLLGKPFTSYRFTPAIQAIQKTLDIIPSTVKLAKGEKEWDDWTIGALESMGYAFGIGGTSQLAGSAKYFKRYMENETVDDEFDATVSVLRAKGGKK